MTSFKIERLPFVEATIMALSSLGDRYTNWPIVYTLDGKGSVYVGESLNAVARMRQHRAADAKRHLERVRLVIDDTFNKSVCLDLESHLIRLFAGDGQYEVLNRNEGITDADYFDRARYRAKFDEIFEELRREGAFTRSISQIENTDLFKLSPFKALTNEQAIAVEAILDGLFDDLKSGRPSTSVIQGDPGTGKTIVAIYLMKLMRDIEITDPRDATDSDSIFSDYFTSGYGDLLRGRRIGLVVPQQSLRKSIQRVFQKTPGLSSSMVLTPFQVGESEEDFDLLLVDETHRLTQRANQPSGSQNKRFSEINRRLFGADDLHFTQLDWVRARSKHQILLLDRAQSVRPADLPQDVLRRVVDNTRRDDRHFRLLSQMRVRAGEDYISYVRQILSPEPPSPRTFSSYDLRMFDDLGRMHDEIRRKDDEVGLARMVAGYAWPWRSKHDPDAYDIEIDGRALRWNREPVDWINSPGSIDEVGSIHTVQGYDLNYAGVVIGPDLRYDTAGQRVVFDRESYHDKKGKENNKQLGITYNDADLLQFVVNIYGVLLTRGMLGTYVYVCDPDLRRYMSRFLPKPAFGEQPGRLS